MPKRPPSEKSLTPESVAAALRARLRGLAEARAGRTGSGYRITGGFGYQQMTASRGVAAYACTRGYVISWCDDAREGAGWYFTKDDAQEGLDYVLRCVREGSTRELERLQGASAV